MQDNTCVCSCVWVRSDSPYKIAAEYEAEHEDEDACAEDHHIDIERKVLEGDGWHSAGLIGVDKSQTAEAPYTDSEISSVTQTAWKQHFSDRSVLEHKYSPPLLWWQLWWLI